VAVAVAGRGDQVVGAGRRRAGRRVARVIIIHNAAGAATAQVGEGARRAIIVCYAARARRTSGLR